MTTTVHEIADGIYRLSTYVPDIAPPAGFTFNQFLVDAEEPLLFHCGPRALFPDVSAAAAKVVPLAGLSGLSAEGATYSQVNERILSPRRVLPKRTFRVRTLRSSAGGRVEFAV